MEKLINTFGTQAIINWSDAENLIRQYNNQGNKLSNQLRNRTVSGFSFPVDELKRIINQHEGDEMPDRVFFALGFHSAATARNGHYGHTIIALGTKVVVNEDEPDNRELDEYVLMKSENDLIYDYCEPCPRKCTDVALHLITSVL